MPQPSRLPAEFLTALGAALPGGGLLLDPADCLPYGYDNSRRQAQPDAVALPDRADQVRRIVGLCRSHRVPLIARGRGTGTTGATVPVGGGLVLSTERMDAILSVDPDNRVMVVQPGVINEAVQDAARKVGFFWPPDPSSAAFCTVGGNLAYNSAGPRAVKYGTPRENTLGLRAVLGSGEELRTGVYTTKGVVGYDLTRLLIGSEGTLGLITEATLKLTPLPETKRTLRAFYADIGAAAAAVARIMAQPETPCALEFIDGAAIAMIRDYAQADLPADAGAMLMVEVDGTAAAIDQAVSAVSRAAGGDGLLRLEAARDAEQVEQMWAARKALSPALRTVAPKKINEDVVVPVSRIPQFIGALERLAAEFAIPIVNFGHAGNGNIHVNLLVDPDKAGESERAERCLQRVFDLVLELNGTLSGEHGVGLEKRPYIGRELDPTALALMRGIKRLCDPDGILNPGKLLPPEDPAR